MADTNMLLKVVGNTDKSATQGEISIADLFKLYKSAAMTTQLTTITHTAPGTPDYAIQNLTQTNPFGFVSADEGNSVLKVIANLQTRVAELEDALQAANLLA